MLLKIASASEHSQQNAEKIIICMSDPNNKKTTLNI